MQIGDTKIETIMIITTYKFAHVIAKIVCIVVSMRSTMAVTVEAPTQGRLK